MSEGFNPQEHLMKVSGKDYLQVAWRIVWMREEHPDWGIQTAPIKLEVDANGGGMAIFHAQITNEMGRIIAEATKHENRQGFPDFIEKAETGAIGRALALCGYGTQFVADELEEGERLADTPIARQSAAAPATPMVAPPPRAAAPAAAATRTPNVTAFANVAPQGCNTSTVLQYLKQNGFTATAFGPAITEVNGWIRTNFPGQPVITGTGEWNPERNEHKTWPSDIYNAAAHYLALCEEPGTAAVTVAAGGVHVADDDVPF